MLQAIAALADELRVTDQLLAERQRVLDAIPECTCHGACIPHALEWIEKAKAAIVRDGLEASRRRGNGNQGLLQ